MNIIEFNKLFPDINNTLTSEENELMLKLAKTPSCMHDPKQAIHRENHVQCGECGLIAKKTISGF